MPPQTKAAGGVLTFARLATFPDVIQWELTGVFCCQLNKLEILSQALFQLHQKIFGLRVKRVNFLFVI